ncbi:MAG: dimethylsulfonioproprionate lyase family protein [Pseudomonadota bacterium]
MTARAAFEDALMAVKEWHAAIPEVHNFCPWPTDLTYAERRPCPLPAMGLLQTNPGPTNALSAPLLQAYQSIAPHLEWRHTYTVEEVGQHFLDTFAWFELAGPTGHFITHQTRITAAYWGPGLIYDRHLHVAEELYTVISGEALFKSDGDADEVLGAGATRYHASNQPHALETQDHPLVVLVFWRGEGLADAPALTPS